MPISEITIFDVEESPIKLQKLNEDFITLEQDEGSEDLSTIVIRFAEIDSLIAALKIIKNAWKQGAQE